MANIDFYDDRFRMNEDVVIPPYVENTRFNDYQKACVLAHLGINPEDKEIAKKDLKNLYVPIDPKQISDSVIVDKRKLFVDHKIGPAQEVAEVPSTLGFFADSRGDLISLGFC